MHLRIFLFGLLFLLPAAYAETITLKPIEKYDENVTVSGEVRAGVMYQQTLADPIPLPPWTVFVDLGGGLPRKASLCGKLISADGVYEASFQFDPGPNMKLSGITSFKLESEHENKLSSYQVGEISVFTYEGSRECRKISNILPSSWSSHITEDINIYLNARQYDTYLLAYKKDERKPNFISCHAISAKQRVAYDTVCTIKQINAYDLSRTRIRRSNGDSYAPIIKLPISSNVK